MAVLHNRPVIRLHVAKNRLLVFDQLLEKNPRVLLRVLKVQLVLILVNRKIFRIHLPQMERPQESRIDNAAKGFDQIAHQGFPVVKQLMVYPHIRIKSVQPEMRVDQIKQKRIPDIQQRIGNIVLGTRQPFVPADIGKIGLKKQFRHTALESQQRIVTLRRMYFLFNSFALFDRIPELAGLVANRFEQKDLVLRLIRDQMPRHRQRAGKSILLDAQNIISLGRSTDDRKRFKVLTHKDKRDPELQRLFDQIGGKRRIADNKDAKDAVTRNLRNGLAIPFDDHIVIMKFEALAFLRFHKQNLFFFKIGIG